MGNKNIPPAAKRRLNQGKKGEKEIKWGKRGEKKGMEKKEKKRVETLINKMT